MITINNQKLKLILGMKIKEEGLHLIVCLASAFHHYVQLHCIVRNDERRRLDIQSDAIFNDIQS